jgi:hypothetical protein
LVACEGPFVFSREGPVGATATRRQVGGEERRREVDREEIPGNPKW